MYLTKLFIIKHLSVEVPVGQVKSMVGYVLMTQVSINCVNYKMHFILNL